ncbi:MAG: histidine kinase [Clostridia bacterium]|nr:histidine kinase [Clostridia bacterium]
MLNSYNQLIELVRSYRWNSLFVKYFKKIFFILFLPFVIIAALLILYTNTNLQHKQDNLNNEYLQKNFHTINSAFESISKQQLMLITNRYISIYFTANDLFSSSIDFKIDMIQLRELLNNILISMNYIDDVQLLSFSNEYVMTTTGSVPLSYQTPFFVPYYEEHKSDFFLLSDNPHFWVVYEYKPYGTPLGLVAFKVDFSKISDQLLYNDGTVYLLSEDNNTLFSTNAEKISTLYEANTDNGNTIMESELDYYNLRLLIDIHPTKNGNHRNLLIFIICFGILLLIPAAISLYLSYQAYNSITKIISALGGYGSDQIAQKNELDYIRLSISKAFVKQQELETELASRMFQLKKMQTLILQTQFNPHFLFNTINLAITKEVSATHADTDVSKILGLLSKLLRISLNTKQNMVTVSEELDYAKTYLKIISIRYDHNFDVEYHIDPKTLSMKTIKLILQPLLENAFEHGIHQLDEEKRGKIIISSQLDYSNLILTVYNNGAPCEPKTLEKLQKMLETEYIPDDSHIGLANVNTRIKLTFGPEYGCMIESDENGTTCTIILPAC